MELYILDSVGRRAQVLEDYESFIWTERFAVIGDFRLTLQSTFENRARLAAGTRLMHNESYRVMMVETVEDKTDKEGRSTLTVTGRSMETIFENRLARDVLSDLTTNPKWILVGYPADIARQMVADICNDGDLVPEDVVPFYDESPGFTYPEDTIDEPSDIIEYEVAPQPLYTALKTLCDVYDMGFRVYDEGFQEPYTFGVYMGADRTTQQTDLPAVVFSPSLDNLQNTTEFTAVTNYKNVAYVISPVGSEIVYATDVDPSITGYARRVLYVQADDIQDVVPADATARMVQRGMEALAAARSFSGFDGELNQNAQYRYGVDYNLGDLVELQSNSGSVSVMQVTEQIFVSDKVGYRSYPTLTTRSLIIPGSWDARSPDEVWDDVDPGETWDDA